MAKNDRIISRLREATPAERQLLASLANLDLTQDVGKDEVALARKIRDVSVNRARRLTNNDDREYRQILLDTIEVAAKAAGWQKPEVSAGARIEHLEEYIYLASAAAHFDSLDQQDEEERTGLEEAAVAALAGKISRAASTPWRSTAYGMAGGAIGGAWPIPTLAVVAALWVLSANTDTMLRIALVLIHIRKRTELEAKLEKDSAA